MVGTAPKPDRRRVLNGVGLAAASLLEGGICRQGQTAIASLGSEAGHVSGRGRHGAGVYQWRVTPRAPGPPCLEGSQTCTMDKQRRRSFNMLTGLGLTAVRVDTPSHSPTCRSAARPALRRPAPRLSSSTSSIATTRCPRFPRRHAAASRRASRRTPPWLTMRRSLRSRLRRARRASRCASLTCAGCGRSCHTRAPSTCCSTTRSSTFTSSISAGRRRRFPAVARSCFRVWTRRLARACTCSTHSSLSGCAPTCSRARTSRPS